MTYEKLLQDVTSFAQTKGFTHAHTPKNLAMAISVESAELLEHFMWSDECNYNDEQKKAIGYEIADVFIYLMHMAKAMEIDLIKITDEKMQINKKRF